MIEDAKGQGQEAWDRVWEAADEIAHHEPAERSMRVARYATQPEELDYTVTKTHAAISYIEAKVRRSRARGVDVELTERGPC